MTTDLSFIHLITNASLVVQLVMLSLLAASVVSWSMIFSKRVLLNKAKKEADRFEEIFWSSEDLTPLYNRISKKRGGAVGMEKLFDAGFKEFARVRNAANKDTDAMLESVNRSMRIAMNKEVDYLETNLSFLATVGSTSPYVGLFGTVWGIMNSFRALGNVQQATIAMVAPGIAEALVATAMGLFAAIPAVIAYNRYSNDVERLINRYDIFLEEFLSILHRHASH
ncbi:MAG: protein TolQ [Gammaproteobacteria bacterium]|nr:protein TolQ [Gammaproteobacteria bacterium]NIN61721.1 protein TolQ [Gammaproteobacteria bacterium]NIO63518.1 protein TolQ [Gammaproteobacteria bacterium]NIP48738.1 protein TolQ [Gammaproteobacteria bacterium]NIQ09190.1 protein TolQ [Gammaproteobacteria bacterium]